MTFETVDRLASIRGSHCVSLFLPTERTAVGALQGPQRLKNLLRSAEQVLMQRGMSRVCARDFLQPIRVLIDDTGFWSRQAGGLAILRYDGGFEMIPTARPLPELAVVGRQPYLVPLLSSVERKGFFILAVSQKRARLLRATSDHLEEVELPGLPASFEDLERFVQTERDVQFHTKSPRAGAVGRRAAVFHGSGVGTDARLHKKRLLEYCQLLDKALRPFLARRTEPLVLMGDQPLVSLFRRASGYPNLVEGAVGGNPELVSTPDLLRKAWALAEPRMRNGRAEALRAWHEGLVPACEGLEDVLPAAHEGRVGSLLVKSGAQCWGWFDPATRQVAVHWAASVFDDDLVNLAVVRTIQNGGRAYVVDPHEVRLPAPIAACLRY